MTTFMLLFLTFAIIIGALIIVWAIEELTIVLRLGLTTIHDEMRRRKL